MVEPKLALLGGLYGVGTGYHMLTAWYLALPKHAEVDGVVSRLVVTRSVM